MSRVGKNPITLPDGVTAVVKGDQLTVKGSKGELTSPIPAGISASVDEGAIVFARANEDKQTRAFHGLARALANNSVQGVTSGFKRELEIQGVGYRAQMKGKTLNMQLGFSHDVDFPTPDGLAISTPDQTHIVIEGIDKQQVGEVAAQIRRFRPPDAYKGKGIRYSDEIVRTKVGKSGAGVGA
ncbi:MAG: 50S ribosomal protein L6 [Acidobacteria bacterium]|nr:50S ribosomal protein L6 [Acidobacteriota bacterium]